LRISATARPNAVLVEAVLVEAVLVEAVLVEAGRARAGLLGHVTEVDGGNDNTDDRSTDMRVWLVGVLMLSLATPVLAGDASKGQALYAVCAACHGPAGAGNQAMNSPKIAGQEPWYLERQLKAFKSGIRGAAPGDMYGAQMRPMAMQLADDAAIADVVAYIGTFPDVRAPVTISGDANAGKALYAVCAACHGQNAEGNAALNGPRLTGQEDWYLVRQLQNYKKGLRGAHPQDMFGMQMRPMASTLVDDKAINDVVAYIETLNP
jgi:cytochrome c oxidase subunit 2